MTNWKVSLADKPWKLMTKNDSGRWFIVQRYKTKKAAQEVMDNLPKVELKIEKDE